MGCSTNTQSNKHTNKQTNKRTNERTVGGGESQHAAPAATAARGKTTLQDNCDRKLSTHDIPLLQTSQPTQCILAAYSGSTSPRTCSWQTVAVTALTFSLRLPSPSAPFF